MHLLGLRQQWAKSEQPELELACQKAPSGFQDFFLFSLAKYGVRRWEGILVFPAIRP